MKQFLVKLVSIPYCHKLFKSANFKTGSICFCTPEICVGTCRRRIHSTVLQDCLRHPLEPHLQLLEVDTSTVRVIRVPQTEESVLLLCASNEFPTHAFIQVYRALKNNFLVSQLAAVLYLFMHFLLHHAFFEKGIKPARCNPALLQNALTLPSNE
jgi:hypothetical protein